MLAKAYTTLLIYLVFGPVFILFDIIPGPGDSALGWFKIIITQVLIFFVVGVLFLLNTVLLGTVNVYIGKGGLLWSAPYIGANPLLVQALISLAIISIIAEADKLVATFIQAKLPAIGGGGFDQIAQAPQQLIQSLQKAIDTRIAKNMQGPGGGTPAAGAQVPAQPQVMPIPQVPGANP